MNRLARVERGAWAERRRTHRPEPVVDRPASIGAGARAPDAPAARDLVRLQRTLGNRAVCALLAAAPLQRQPDKPPPDADRAAPPAGRATLNFLPVLPDLTPPSAGVTRNDDPVFDITAYASGAAWKCVITTADQQSHQGVRLPDGAVEVTPEAVAAAADCSVLQTVIASLTSGADQGPHSGFYMMAAIQAHEDVHLEQYRAAVAPHYVTLKRAVEALTVPRASQATAAEAAAAIKALPAYKQAMATFHRGDVAANNAGLAHAPAAPFKRAEHAVVDPMIATIRARRAALKCPR